MTQELNKNRLNMLADIYDHIAASPTMRHQYKQVTWGEEGVERYLNRNLSEFDLTEFEECGSACCIAGQAVVAFGNKSGLELHMGSSQDKGAAVSRYASSLLGITDGDTKDGLFAAQPLHAQHYEGARPEEAAYVLRNLADTGEVHWKDVRRSQTELQ